MTELKQEAFKDTRGPKPAFFFFLWNWIKQACTDSPPFLFCFHCVHLHKFGKLMEQNIFFNPTLPERLIALIVPRSNKRTYKFRVYFHFGGSPESLCILCDESLEKSFPPTHDGMLQQSWSIIAVTKASKKPQRLPQTCSLISAPHCCWLAPLGSCLNLYSPQADGCSSAVGW